MAALVLLWLKGAGIGAAIAAPVGPMSVLCMRRTLVHGWRAGFTTGAGIACADGLYALVAALGLSGVIRFVIAYERPLHVVAGAVLLYLGWRTLRSTKPGKNVSAPAAAAAPGGFGSALALTLTNPTTILSFAAVVTLLAPVGFGPRDAALIASGVLSGSLTWWLVLTLVVAAARHAIGARARRWVDRLSAAVFGLLGVAEIARGAE